MNMMKMGLKKVEGLARRYKSIKLLRMSILMMEVRIISKYYRRLEGE